MPQLISPTGGRGRCFEIPTNLCMSLSMTVKIEKEMQRKCLAEHFVVCKFPPPFYFGGICVNHRSV